MNQMENAMNFFKIKRPDFKFYSKFDLTNKVIKYIRSALLRTLM